MITLENALTLLATSLNVAPQTLIDFAAEDTIGGYHSDEKQSKWPCGSLWEVEGKMLYAAVRALRPSKVLEIGTHYGASATHILTALEANGKGKLLSIDVMAGSGAGIPDALRPRWQFAAAEGAQYIHDHTIRAEIVFEDALHGYEDTRAILKAVQEHMTPRLVFSHDSEHFDDGVKIRAAWKDVYDTFTSVLIEPSDCGRPQYLFH